MANKYYKAYKFVVGGKKDLVLWVLNLNQVVL